MAKDRGARLLEARVIPIRSADDALNEEARTASRIARAVFAGDSDAERQMVERYSKGLRFLLARKIGDDERARDLLQETFCIAIEKLRVTELDNPERLAGYLRGIAVRVAMNAARKRNREPYPIDNEAVAAIPDYEPQPLQAISQDDTRKAVQDLLDTMPVKRDRDLLIRLYVYDQDKSEICQALRLDSLHFNRVLHRAKARFRKIVETTAAATVRDDGQAE